MRCFFVKKIIIIVPILIIVFFIAFKNENKEIRVRVIPQDNSEEQYEIKQEVVKDLCGIFSIIIDDKMSYKETDSAIQANLDKIKACLEKYDWPGNVRQLESCLAVTCELNKNQEIGPDDLIF